MSEIAACNSLPCGCLYAFFGLQEKTADSSPCVSASSFSSSSVSSPSSSFLCSPALVSSPASSARSSSGLRIEFFYDIMSPYSFFAFEVLSRYQRLWNVTLELRPILLGGTPFYPFAFFLFGCPRHVFFSSSYRLSFFRQCFLFF